MNQFRDWRTIRRWFEVWEGGRQSAEIRRKPRPGARGGGWPFPQRCQDG